MWVMKMHLLEKSWEHLPGRAGAVGLCSSDLRNLERQLFWESEFEAIMLLLT